MTDCQHQLSAQNGRLGCSKCNAYWRGTQALETLVGQMNSLQEQVFKLEDYIIDQYTSALGKLGLEPCLSCGEFMLDLHVQKGREPYHPQRFVCDFHHTGIHIKVAGDCILCTPCLLQKLEENYFDVPELQAIAAWMVKHFKDVRLPHVAMELAPTYSRIASYVVEHISDEMIQRRVP